MSVEFLVTAVVVVLMPGTGVIYTLTNGVFHGRRETGALGLSETGGENGGPVCSCA